MEPVLQSFLSTGTSVPPNATCQLKILTYNVLAQRLVRRDMYPTNGNAIKWSQRGRALKGQIEAYDPDIAVLQEVDENRAGEIAHWIAPDPHFRFAKYGSKGHGILIVSKRLIKTVTEINLDNSRYDNIKIPDQQVCGGNLGLMVQAQTSSGNFIWVGTCHLYWHPYADYERARQLLIIMSTAHKVQRETGQPVILTGDFNSTPDSPAYLLATEGIAPAAQLRMLEESIETEVFGGMDTLDKPRNDKSVVGNPTMFSDVAHRKEQLSLLLKQYAILKANNGLLTSVYGKWMKKVDPGNCDEVGEPRFTNWTDNFKATIDYIFTNPAATTTRILQLPSPADMGPEPNSIPRTREGECHPSDHLPLMAELAF